MRVERKLEAPPPPVSPERAQNKPAPPPKTEDPVRTQDRVATEKPPEKAKDVGRNVDVQA